jgi:hypothetical protein
MASVRLGQGRAGQAVVTVEELRDALKDRMHELNWMRKKHGEIEKEAQQTDE